jgi:hypothetical protein
MKIIYLMFVILLGNGLLFAQKKGRVEFSEKADTLIARKLKCNCGRDGFKIKIQEVKSDGKYRWSKDQVCNYTYLYLYAAKEDLKIGLLQQLLSFASDTSRVCMNVYPYWMSLVDSMVKIEQPTYRVNVDALYHINYVFFGALAPYYAPFPVLYDTVTNQEINNDMEKVREVFSYYREWYNQCKLDRFRNYSFPLLHTRYRWKFGKTDDRKMEGIPVVRGEMLRRIGQPKKKL